ncbi:hypothetical protein ACSAZK_00590 [Methanosarcina sp. Mfa9]|uniref:hypothetical protein n=1 Tax=Methanosarcina sp. Mfa9 TaxID=3439063 RepID=UPI003F86A39A
MEYNSSKSNFGSLSFGLKFRHAKCRTLKIYEACESLQDPDTEPESEPFAHSRGSCPNPEESGIAAPFSRTTIRKRAGKNEASGISGLPVCPAGEIGDKVLYAAGPGSSGNLYLPRYRLAELQLPNHNQYLVSLKKSRQGWDLKVRLEKYPYPGLPAHGLKELPHEISLTLRSSGIPEDRPPEFSFQELFRTAAGLNAVLNIPTLPERDMVYSILTKPGCGTELIVCRRIEVAVPPESKENANLPPDSSCFRKVRRVLENPIPFNFPPELHEYIFRDRNEIPGVGLICRQAGANNYYQVQDNPHIFYYLPDSFRLARRPAPPCTPLLSVRFTGRGKVNLEYTARPTTDQRRLEKDAKLLETFIPDSPDNPAGEQKVRLRPLLPEPGKLKYYLGLPGEGGPGPLRERKGAHLCLQEGIRDRLILTVPEFREVFEALFRPESAIFRGRVEVELGGGLKESVPFIARLDRMEGRLFDYEENVDASGCGEVILRNLIESPLKIRGLAAKFIREPDEVIDAKIQGSPRFRLPELPLSLKPAEERRFPVLPERPLPEGPLPFRLKLEVEGPEVLPDPEAIWDSIAESGISPESRVLTVKTFVFRDEEAAADIEELIVEFPGGKTVELSRKRSTAKVNLDLPLKDRVLHREAFELCHYTVKTVDRKGRVSAVREGTASGDLLIVEGR